MPITPTSFEKTDSRENENTKKSQKKSTIDTAIIVNLENKGKKGYLINFITIYAHFT